MKARVKFVCQNCGASYAKWSGKCDQCGQWNTLLEQAVEEISKTKLKTAATTGKLLETMSLNSIIPADEKQRHSTGFPDLDVVLGGGILSGSVSLLAGQPGIGKSTILMQISANIAQSHQVLYISGEESASQVKLRATRLGSANPSSVATRLGSTNPSSVATKTTTAHGKAPAISDKLHFASSTSGNDIAKTIASGSYDLVIIDSIQTLALDEITSAPGTVSQVTNCGNLIIRAAKKSNTAVIIVGHVTKDGTLAGPKVLEHLVDVVLNFEGDRYGGFKTVRAIKNRFGSTNEVAIYEMTDRGLAEVKNPSEALLAERQNTDGSIILATLEGTRPILVEIQALVNPTSFGYPKRTASGFDLNRLNLLIAVLEKRTKLKLSDKDVFINVVGGLRLQDSASDLAVAMAIASATAGKQLDEKFVVFGEVGLGGEIRSARASDRRIAEAKKLGFTHAIAPATTKLAQSSKYILPVRDIRSALIKYMSK